MWIYNLTTGYWTWISGGINKFGSYGTKGVPTPYNAPGARYLASIWFNNHDAVYLFGGLGLSQKTAGMLE